MTDKGKINLICFPYAGGSPGIFAGWNEDLDESINLCPVLYPGRDIRLGEEMPEKITDLVKEFVDSNPELFSKPYALLGYCVGGIAAFETAIYNFKKYNTIPLDFFSISFGSPAYRMSSKEICPDVSKEGLIRYLLDNKIIDEEYARDDLFLDYYLPIIAADLKVVDSYDYSTEEKLDCPVWSFFGNEDNLFSSEDKILWKKYTSKGYEYEEITGGHYCMQENQKKIIEFINLKLKEKMK